jgi:hypothetical protein
MFIALDSKGASEATSGLGGRIGEKLVVSDGSIVEHIWAGRPREMGGWTATEEMLGGMMGFMGCKSDWTGCGIGWTNVGADRMGCSVD